MGLLIAPVLLLSTSVPPLSGQARKPLLSEAIRTTLEKEGIEAKRRYEEIARGQRDDYEFDLNGLAQLAGTYMSASTRPPARPCWRSPWTRLRS